MENEKRETIVLRPVGVETGIWVLILLAAFLLITLIRLPAYPSFEALPVFLMSFFLLYIFFVIHIFRNYRIIIRENEISFPKANIDGLPSFFASGNIIVDIASIRKIIKYPALFEGNQGWELFAGHVDPTAVGDHVSTKFRKISITSSQATVGIYLSYMSWGEESIGQLIDEILERNENVQIIDYDHFIKK